MCSKGILFGSDQYHSCDRMSTAKSPRRKPGYPTSLTDLTRYRKTAHGHDGSSRVVMVRKTDQRTIASMRDGEKPKLETITRETIETFRGPRTECKITTEKKDCQDSLPPELIESFTEKIKTPVKKTVTRRTPLMEFQQECLKAHNECRKKHGVPPLKLNKELCRLSQDHANFLVRRSVLEHSKNKDYGENIYCISSTNYNITITGDEPVKSWYAEVNKHNFGIEPSCLSSGHFTQVVWKDTKELGVAFAKEKGKIVVVALYSPAGNIIQQFAENVPPAGGFSTEINGNMIETVTESISSKLTVSHKSATNGSERDFEKEFLNAHNEYRKKHGVPPLKLDRKLCKFSEEWAKILAAKNVLEHRKNSPYGENIYCMYSSDYNYTITGHTPVDTWYEEVKHHPFGKEPNSLRSGHFTQVVWKTTESLGVGIARSRQGYIYVVANYSPAGNFVGHYTENVPPPIKSSSTSVSEKEEEKLTPTTISGSITDDSLNEEEFNQFVLDGLKVHNELRKKHGAPPMKLSSELCDLAKEWAEHCAKTSTISHRQSSSFGENIFCTYSSDYSYTPTAREAIKKWYDEVKEHTFGVETVNHKSLHFTQIVWKNSTELGIALAKNQNGESYVIANYKPRGNIIGQFNSNVLKPKP